MLQIKLHEAGKPCQFNKQIGTPSCIQYPIQFHPVQFILQTRIINKPWALIKSSQTAYSYNVILKWRHKSVLRSVFKA